MVYQAREQTGRRIGGGEIRREPASIREGFESAITDLADCGGVPLLPGT